MTVRRDAVAGQFYPADAAQIEEMFSHYNRILQEHLKDPKLLQTAARAIIVPHAGYVYSGFTANIAHRILANSGVRRVVVIGPSHRVYLQGTSVSDFERYETPLGDLPVDTALVSELKERFSLAFIPDAHHEHSTEVQMPFIKRYLPEAKVVELVYGDEDPARLAEVIAYLLRDPDTGVVISTDLSHYYDIEHAKRLDSICLEAVQEERADLLHKGCEACGKIGVEAMLLAARELDLSPLLLDYRTSADASGDTSQVVGYMSAAFL